MAQHYMSTGRILRIILTLLFVGGVLQANEKVAVIVKLNGDVRVTAAKSFKSTAAKKGQILQDGDIIETGAEAYCAIKFLDDKSLLRIRENSACTIEGKREGNSIVKNIFVEVGSFFLSLFQQPKKFTVSTPTSVASVKGTKFWVMQLAQSGETRYICTEGSVEVSNKAGKVLLRRGQTAIVLSRNSSPEVRLTRSGDIPLEDGFSDGATRELEFEFNNDNGQKKVIRIQIEGQE
jgi:hypothetical protein